MRIPVLHFGIVPKLDDTATRQGFQSVCDSLGFILGTRVIGHRFRAQAELVNALQMAKLDLAWLSPAVALKAQIAKLCEPVISLVRCKATDYSSVLFTQPSSRIRTISDLRDVKASWVSRESASGYLVPVAAIRSTGTALNRAFAVQTFEGTHNQVIDRVLDGSSDVGATWAHTDPLDSHRIVSSSWTECGHPAEGLLQTISVSGPIPTDVLSVHRTMSPDHISELQYAFTQLAIASAFADAVRVFGCESFAPCSPSHFGTLRTLIRFLDMPNASAPFD